MKVLLIGLMCFMVGCTTYDVKRDSEGIVNVKVRSTRSFETPDLHYRRTGQDVTFDFSAASVDNNTEAFLGMFQGMMGMMFEMMRAAAQPVPQ